MRVGRDDLLAAGVASTSRRRCLTMLRSRKVSTPPMTRPR